MLASAGLVVLAGLTAARRTLAPTSGTIRLPELHAPVTVARDNFGVPYLDARDEHDLFMAQGYVTAQDRLWQMLARRQAARGQLADWLGEQAAPADATLRRQGFVSQAESVSSSLESERLAWLEAYAAGVNACLQTCPQPVEIRLLRWQGKLGQVEPWTWSDSLALALVLQWMQEQSGSAGLSQKLIERLGQARAAELAPEGVSPEPLAPPADPALGALMPWTGLALVQDDLRRAASAPGLPAAWYMAALYAPRAERSALVGATWPGLPGVILDHVTAEQPASAPESQRVLLQQLLALPPAGWLQTRVHGMLRQWNGDLSSDERLGNASAAVYQVWVWHLARDTFQDELGAELFNHYWVAGMAPPVLARLIARPDAAWWDDVTTPQVERRDDVIRGAYGQALDYIGRHYGDLHTIWEWDTLHKAQFRHPLGERRPLTWLVNRAYKLGGDSTFDPGPAGPSAAAFAPVLIPSVRIQAGQFALAGGQSGNPFSPHYADLLPLWQRGQMIPFQDAARPGEPRAQGVLTLTP